MVFDLHICGRRLLGVVSLEIWKDKLKSIMVGKLTWLV